jgi:hypothetical protein
LLFVAGRLDAFARRAGLAFDPDLPRGNQLLHYGLHVGRRTAEIGGELADRLAGLRAEELGHALRVRHSTRPARRLPSRRSARTRAPLGGRGCDRSVQRSRQPLAHGVERHRLDGPHRVGHKLIEEPVERSHHVQPTYTVRLTRLIEFRFSREAGHFLLCLVSVLSIWFAASRASTVANERGSVADG